MYPYRANRYAALPRPMAFDRRAFGVWSGSGVLPSDVDQQLSAIQRRQALRDALRLPGGEIAGALRLPRRPPN